jgi:hypothetical protein
VFDGNRNAMVLHDTFSVRDFVLTALPAAATDLGGACAVGATMPILLPARLPQLGGDCGLDVRRVPLNAPVILVGDGPAGPVAWPNGCVQHVANPVLLGAAPTGGGGSATFAFSVPMTAVLAGLSLHTQAVTLVPGGALFGIGDLTNALALVVGD